MERLVLHIDVNNAFLSWTAIDMLKNGFKKDIRDEVSVIGGNVNSRRGVVLAKSNLAKKKGIKTGETMYQALLKDKNVKSYPPNFDVYQKMSNDMFELLYKYSPDIEKFSIDECFLEFTNVKYLYKDVHEFAKLISKDIKKTLGFTVNIGIGNNKLCAKMASNFSKPDKIHTLFLNEVEKKMWPLDVSELLWIGKKTTLKLRELNINNIGELAKADEALLKRFFKNQASKMKMHAKGIDYDPVMESISKNASVGKSTTFMEDTNDINKIHKTFELLSDQVASKLRKDKKYASGVSINFKNSYFKTYSKQRKLTNPTNNTKVIFENAKELFEEVYSGEDIRLVGVTTYNFVDSLTHQLSIFESDDDIKEDLNIDKTIDELREKFGETIISSASIYNKKRKK